MSAYYALVAQQVAQVIGGMETNTLALLFYCRHTDGLLTLEMKILRND
jgi:hypothetical protein